MKPLIVDASVGIKWIIPEEGSDQANTLFDFDELFIVPKLFFLEVDAVLTKQIRLGIWNISEISEVQKIIDEISFRVINYSTVRKLAIEIATELPIALYDGIYLAAAVSQNGIMVTADQKLVNGLANTSLNDYLQSIWDLE